jgi:hypothetical protein
MAWSQAGGAFRSGNQTVGGGGILQFTLNAVHTGFAYTQIVSGAIVVKGSGSILVNARVTIPTFGGTARVRINGSSTDLAVGNSGTTSNIVNAIIPNLHDGDLLQLWVTGSTNGANATGNQASTFLTYVPLSSAQQGNGVSLGRAALF